MNIPKFLICILALVISPLAWSAGVGMVLDVRGAATAEKDGKTARLEITDPLLPGMKVSVAAGNEIGFVFYPKREMYRLTGPATLMVEDTAVKPVKGNRPKAKPLPEEKTQVARGYQGNVIPAALVMKRAPTGQFPPQLAFPADGETVLSDRVTFAWEAAAAPLKFRLFDGSTLLHEQMVEGNRLELPTTVTLQEGRSYRWELAEDGSTRAAAAKFSLAPKAVRKQLAELRPADSAAVADWTLYALGLQQAGAISEARTIWRRVAKERPGSSVAQDRAQ
jgi:hypothetical protein